MAFEYDRTHPVLKRALDLEQLPDISALGTYQSRQKALYMAISEAAGQDPSLINTPLSRLSDLHAMNELRKAADLEWVEMDSFLAASFRDKRIRESQE